MKTTDTEKGKLERNEEEGDSEKEWMLMEKVSKETVLISRG